jgi:hypothetical protein
MGSDKMKTIPGKIIPLHYKKLGPDFANKAKEEAR